jgi:energy-coupling factor transporter ATP-binding protein EcfA2
MPIGGRGLIALSFKEPDQYNRRQTLRAPLVDDGTSPLQRTLTRAKRGSRTLATLNASQEKLLISTANITMQFGAKPLFENVSVKFNGGNRYGLIGANGCGKSTFMKILGGDLEPSGGQVMLEPNVRLGKLRQDQFAYEEFTVIDTVIMGHEELWKVKAERDRIYSLPEMSEEDGMAVAELETEFAEMDGYTAESRAGELLLGLGIGIEQHFGPMSEVVARLETARIAGSGTVLRSGSAVARRTDQPPGHQHHSLAGNNSDGA